MELVEIFNIICKFVESLCDYQLIRIIIMILLHTIGLLLLGMGVLYFLLKRKNATEHHWHQKIFPIAKLGIGLSLVVSGFIFALQPDLFSINLLVFIFLLSAFLVVLGYKYKSLLAFKNKT